MQSTASDAQHAAALRDQGIAAVKAGDYVQGRQLLEQAARLNVADVTIWLWLSGLLDSAAERHKCLEYVLQLDPANAAAQRGLALLGPRREPSAAGAAASASPLVDQTAGESPADALACQEQPAAGQDQPQSASPARSARSGWLLAGLAAALAVLLMLIVLALNGRLAGRQQGQLEAPMPPSRGLTLAESTPGRPAVSDPRPTSVAATPALAEAAGAASPTLEPTTTPAPTATPAATATPVIPDQVAVQQARQLFERYLRLGAAYDPAMARLYADEALVRYTRRYLNGEIRVVQFSGAQWKGLLRESMEMAKAAGDKSTYSDISYTREGLGVRIRATRYAHGRDYYSPCSLFVAPAASGKWLIYEEIGETRPATP